MNNIFDYVKWIGNFSFREKEFCDVDALVLAQLSYFDFKLFKNYGQKPLTLRETYLKILAERQVQPVFSGRGNPWSTKFIEAAAQSARFGSMLLKNYVEKLDHQRAVQFSAVTFEQENDFNFIAYRGTDDTLAGWKEDFMISFTRTEAQELATEYAKSNIVPGTRNFICGHSKGANLALYAAAHLRFEIWDHVEQVYLLDGPGFCPEVLDTSTIAKVNRRAMRIIPKFCVIGKLFEPEISNTVIVDSSAEGLNQHDLFSWGVDYGELVRVSENDPQAKKLNNIIDKWIENVSQKERKIFVDEFFGALSADGALTVTDVMKDGVGGIENLLLKLLNSSSTTRRTVASLPTQAAFGNIFTNIRRMGFVKWLDECQVLKCFILIALGIFFLFASEKSLEITAMVFFLVLAVAELVLTIKRLYQAKWNFVSVKERIYLLVILLALCVVIVVKENALFMLGSILCGVFAIILAFRQLAKATAKTDNIFMRVIHALETILLFIYGASFLVAPYDTIFAYAMSVGILLIIDGAVRLGFRIYRQIRPQTSKRRRYHER
ncbi:MAG: DUF2974 domain-containing protein [Ruminococcus sp.]|nr:DUF2974 domain-containing protein [Ruminococcus sp.]